MSKNRFTRLLPLTAAIALAGCANVSVQGQASDFLVSGIEQHDYSGEDDLLTAGLGADGLKNPVAPAFVDAQRPTPAELRRRAIWSNWRGIADLAPGGGYGELYGFIQPVPGREYRALAKLPKASQPHRVMVQIPDNFDLANRCVVVTASSGSRGIYGAIALAGSWGLAHGCAVAYTDKGNGTGYVDTATGQGSRLDGTRGAAGEQLEFNAPVYAGEGLAPIAIKHAHSADNPEADWGLHVRQAAEFALQVLASARPDAAPFTFSNTHVIAVGVSNAGGAVLRAAELSGDWLDGVVAVSPNIYPEDGGRALYDYATEAALYMPCALNASAFDSVVLARPGNVRAAAGDIRCSSLHEAGLLKSTTTTEQAEEAHRHLAGNGWTDAAISAGAISTVFDLWRAVAVTYASSYLRSGASDMPCGFSLVSMDAKGVMGAPSAAEQAAWWSDASGIAPGAGVGIRDSMAGGGDPSLPGLNCLRALWQEQSEAGMTLRASITATRAALPIEKLPVLVIHGQDDGLVPEAFSGGAYAQWARSAGRDVRYWRVANAQHFDAFLGLPILAANYLPMMPYAYRGLDAMWALIMEQKPLPGDTQIVTRKRKLDAAGLEPLSSANLGTMP